MEDDYSADESQGSLGDDNNALGQQIGPLEGAEKETVNAALFRDGRIVIDTHVEPVDELEVEYKCFMGRFNHCYFRFYVLISKIVSIQKK
jgi:hypothetical protein